MYNDSWADMVMCFDVKTNTLIQYKFLILINCTKNLPLLQKE